MNLTQINQVKDFNLGDVKVSFTTNDKQLLEINLTSGGQKYLIKNPNTYSNNLSVYRVDEFVVQKKHVLEGTVLGIKVEEFFDYAHLAVDRQSKLLDADPKATLSVSEKDVKFDDAGIVTHQPSDIEAPF